MAVEMRLLLAGLEEKVQLMVVCRTSAVQLPFYPICQNIMMIKTHNRRDKKT